MLLTHQHPGQVLRLARRLVQSFDGAPIVCHHDFGQAPLDVTAFPTEVRFVRPHVPTRWADFSLVEATRAALALLYDHGRGPDWVAVLSGADYPLRSGRQVLADLERHGADVYMRHRLITPDMLAARRGSAPRGHEAGEDWENPRKFFRRYYRQMLRIPLPAWGGTPRQIQIRTARRWIVKRLAPYNERFRCYVGPQWFTLNRRAVEYALTWHDRNPWLADYLAARHIPDESYFQTILCNAEHLRVCNEHFRYIDWSQGGSSPRVLGLPDLSSMLVSPAHFARKFLPDDPVLDRVEEALDAAVA